MSIPVEVTFESFDVALAASTAIARELRVLEQTMLEDQGTAVGRPGTIGYDARKALMSAKAAIDNTWISR